MNFPLYKSHKVVGAAKIATVEIIESDGSARLTFEGLDETRVMSPEWMFKHGAKAGGYFVVYEDDYTSFSPAEAFESGYTPLEAGDPLTIDDQVETSIEAPARGTLEPFLRRIAGKKATFDVRTPRGTNEVVITVSNFEQTERLSGTVIGDVFIPGA